MEWCKNSQFLDQGRSQLWDREIGIKISCKGKVNPDITLKL